jgi:protein-tyrosine phosphatase
MTIHFARNLLRYYAAELLHLPQKLAGTPKERIHFQKVSALLNQPILARVGNRSYHVYFPTVKQYLPLQLSFKGQPAHVNWDAKQQVGQFHYPAKSFHPVFEIAQGNGKVMPIAQKLLPVHGTHHFRDLGGYTTESGAVVAWGKIYRSDHLAQIRPRGYDQLTRHLGIRTIIDFRGIREAQSARFRQVKKEGIRMVNIPISHGNAVGELKEWVMTGKGNAIDPNKMMEEAYRYMALEATAQFRTFFDVVKDPESYPLVFHCTAGKDRTGFAAALLLHALGVPMQTILADFMASNLLREPVNKAWIQKGRFFLDPDILRPLLILHPDLLTRAFRQVETHFGSLHNFIRAELGLQAHEQLALQQRLLTFPGPTN